VTAYFSLVFDAKLRQPDALPFDTLRANG
jgi:hypothetical protein